MHDDYKKAARRVHENSEIIKMSLIIHWDGCWINLGAAGYQVEQSYLVDVLCYDDETWHVCCQYNANYVIKLSFE